MPRSWNECEKYDRIIEKKPLPLKPFENGHFTKGRSFTLSDERSVSFMFDKTNHGKVNDQILLWSLELSQFGYEMWHKPGVENVASDALSRGLCFVEASWSPKYASCLTGNPWYAKLYQLVRARNFSFTGEEVCRLCQVCTEAKPRFTDLNLKRLWRLLKRGNVYLLILKSSKPYILVVVGEYSQFPFVLPCKRRTSKASVDRTYLVFLPILISTEPWR